MRKATIPLPLRRKVEESARLRCGYCLASQAITGARMEIEHLIPEALGGATEESNLWLACTPCNRARGDRTHADDPLTGETVPLFSPRNQAWHEHFEWGDDGTVIVGITPCGRATAAALHLNNEVVVGARSLWVQAGWWPPEE